MKTGRSAAAVVAQFRNSAGSMRDRRQERGGAKNEQLPYAVTDPRRSPMIASSCTCCDYCAYCRGLDMQGNVNAVVHAQSCPWMALQIGAVPIDDGCHRHVWALES